MRDYKKAFSIAEAWYKNAEVSDTSKRILEDVFPELKQSEDEKIIGELICFLNAEVVQCKARDKYIAWLIGQKNSKHSESSRASEESWSIEMAEEGDILAMSRADGPDTWQKIVIFQALTENGVKGYGITLKNEDMAFNDKVPYYSTTWTRTLRPASKEQKSLLINKLMESARCLLKQGEDTILSPDIKELICNKVNVNELSRIYDSSLPFTGDFESYRLALVDSYKKGIMQAIDIINKI